MPSTVLGTGNDMVCKAETDSGGLMGETEQADAPFLYNFTGVPLKDNKLHILKVYSLTSVHTHKSITIIKIMNISTTPKSYLHLCYPALPVSPSDLHFDEDPQVLPSGKHRVQVLGERR